MAVFLGSVKGKIKNPEIGFWYTANINGEVYAWYIIEKKKNYKDLYRVDSFHKNKDKGWVDTGRGFYEGEWFRKNLNNKNIKKSKKPNITNNAFFDSYYK
jgi:hypothetical protein